MLSLIEHIEPVVVCQTTTNLLSYKTIKAASDLFPGEFSYTVLPLIDENIEAFQKTQKIWTGSEPYTYLIRFVFNKPEYAVLFKFFLGKIVVD